MPLGVCETPKLTAMTLIPTILSGDPEFRLWSRAGDHQPRAFIRLSDGQSLLQKAFLRAQQLPGVQEVLTVTNRELFFSSEDEYREIKREGTATSFVLEPVSRGTAAALCAAALQVAQVHGEQAMMLVLPADHVIAQQAVFEAAVQQALSLAAQGKIAALGVAPTSAQTRYGYIEIKDQRVAGFIEKPGFEQAQALISKGRHVWNTGIYAFSAGTFVRELQAHAPELLTQVQLCLQSSRAFAEPGFSQVQLDVQAFQHVPGLSIEKALMESTDQMALVMCDMGWSDIDQWAALGDLTPPDAQGNRIQGAVHVQGSTNCIIQSQGRLIGAVGLNNLLVVDTPQAILVADKSQAPDLQALLAQVQAQGLAYQAAQVQVTPWGKEQLIHESPGLKIKRLEMAPGAGMSLQLHQHRSEHWVVVSGLTHIATGDQDIVMSPNRSAYISAGQKHRLYNPGKTPCVLIEIQSGNYLGEDDIVRFEEKLMA